MNIPILFIGLSYLILSNINNYWVFSFRLLAFSITYLLLGVLIIIGSILCIVLCYKKRNTFLLVRIFYWFLFSSIILLSLIVFLSPISISGSDGIIIFIEYSTIIVVLPSIIFLSVINPKVDLKSVNINNTRWMRKIFRYLVPFVLLLLVLSTPLFWYLFMLKPFGVYEGMAYFLLLAVLRFDMVSFIPLCGIIHFMIKDSTTLNFNRSNFNLKILIPIIIIPFSGIISTVVIYIVLYFRGFRIQYLVDDALLSYVFMIGAISLLLLFYLVEKHKISIFNNETKLGN